MTVPPGPLPPEEEEDPHPAEAKTKVIRMMMGIPTLGMSSAPVYARRKLCGAFSVRVFCAHVQDGAPRFRGAARREFLFPVSLNYLIWPVIG